MLDPLVREDYEVKNRDGNIRFVIPDLIGDSTIFEVRG